MRSILNIGSVLLLLSLSSCGNAQSRSSQDTKAAEEAGIAISGMEDLLSQHRQMPAIPWNYPPEHYINTTSTDLRESLKGNVVLLDIWDMSCINCIHTLPHVKEWNERYASRGLVTIGVHSPEFDFEKDPGKVKAAVHKFGLMYPVVVDNEFSVWHALNNQYWPAYYLYDRNGILRTVHVGEGDYQSFEAFIQKLLLEPRS